MVFLKSTYFKQIKDFKIPEKPFRDRFVLPSREMIKWFPTHMHMGMKKMQQRIKTIDCVIEVHDARIPLSGRNPAFKQTVIGPKPHILVLNKRDLVNNKFNSYIIEYIQKRERISNVIYTDCKDQSILGINELVPVIISELRSAKRYNRVEIPDYNVMIIGVPNVGKSSLINAFRSSFLGKKQACEVGPIAGVTKTVATRIKVSNTPEIYVLDTPGILTPTIANVTVGMKLALCSTFRDHNVGVYNMADFLLFWCNKQNSDCYFDFFGINEACDDIGLLLAKKSIDNNWYKRIKDYNRNLIKKPDLDCSASLFIESFRNGLLGPLILDSDDLNIY